MKLEIALLACALHVLCGRCSSESTIRPTKHMRIEGVIRNVMVVGESASKKVVCCSVHEGRTRLFVCSIGGEGPPVEKFQDEVQHVSFDAAGNLGVFVSLKGGVTFVDMESWERIARPDVLEVKCACVEPGSKSAVIVSQGTRIGRLHMKTGEIQRLPNCTLENAARAMKLSSDGKWLIIGCDRGEVLSYDLEMNVMSRISNADLQGNWKDRVNCISIVRVPDQLVWARFGGVVFVKRGADEEPKVLVENSGLASAMIEVPQLQAVAVSSGELVRLLRIDSGKVLAEFGGDGSIVWSVAVEGARLIGGTWDGNILFWDISDLR